MRQARKFLLITSASFGAAIPAMPAFAQTPGGQMMGGSGWGGMMYGMGLFWLLGIAVLVLAVAALIKYIFRD